MSLTVLICSILFLSSDTVQVEKLPFKELFYTELPEVVQLIYKEEVLNIKEYREIAVSTNPSEKIIFKKHSMKNLFDLMKHGFVYEFSRSDIVYTLQANKGDPFVFHGKKFYYTSELNLNSKNFESTRYIEVTLIK